MPAKVNCASAWVNQTAGRSAQYGGSHTATLDISAGAELFIVCIVLCRGHQWFIHADFLAHKIHETWPS
jgi:hypothetical protein